MPNTTNVIIKSALDHIYLEHPDFMFFMQRSDIEAQLQTALDDALPKEFGLSTSEPDYEAILLKLVQELQVYQPWKDTITAATGQTLLRNISAGINYLHFAIMRASQTTFLKPGTPKSSVYAAMASQGVNPRRRIPAKLDAHIEVPDHQGSFVIPKFTQFTIANTHFFNRDDIIYTEFELYKNVTLVQGTKLIQAGTAAGNNYETIEIGYENFQISDEDVYVTVNDEYWTKTDVMVWNAKTRDKIFFVTTLETGNIAVKFGNDIYGKKLTSGDDISIIWFETLGKSVGSIAAETIFDTILSSGVPLKCTTLTSPYGMDDELPVDFYINEGPFLRATQAGAVRRNGYSTIAKQYPGVRDALFRGQAELNPGKRNWMNIVQATILNSNAIPLTDAEWERFVEYMVANSVSLVELTRRDPFIIPIDITANLYCSSSTILQRAKAATESAVLDFNKPRSGAVGYSIYNSDLNSLLEGNAESISREIREQIEYVEDININYHTGFPTSTLPMNVGIDGDGNIIADYYSYVAIRSVTITPFYTPRRSKSGRRDYYIGG